MTAYVRRAGCLVNHKWVQRLMQLMDLQAVYPQPRPKGSVQAHKVYPYLLRGVQITRSNQVCGTGITYIRMQEGFMYLVAIMIGSVAIC